MRTLVIWKKKKEERTKMNRWNFCKAEINDFPFFSFLVYLAKFLSVLNFRLLIGASCNGTKFEYIKLLHQVSCIFYFLSFIFFCTHPSFIFVFSYLMIFYYIFLNKSIINWYSQNIFFIRIINAHSQVYL